jgi:hypothetical protein
MSDVRNPNVQSQRGAAGYDPAGRAYSPEARAYINAQNAEKVAPTAARAGLRGVASRIGGAAADFTRGTMSTVGGLAAGADLSAAKSFATPTEEYTRRFGTQPGESFFKDVGARSLGALQDLGNTLTFGLADRFGNLIGGEGFRPSEDVQPDRYRQPPGTYVKPAAPVKLGGYALGDGSDIVDKPTPGQAQDAEFVERTPQQQEEFLHDRARQEMLQDRAYQEHQDLLRRQYAPTQYNDEPSSTPSLRRDGFGMPGTPGMGGPQSLSDLWRRNAAMRQGLAYAQLAQKDREAMLKANTDIAGHRIAADAANTGHLLTAQASANQLAVQQAQNQRDYDLRRAEAFGPDGTGGTQGRAAAEARDKADAAMRTNIASMIPPTVDAKGNKTPDTDTASRYFTGLNAMVAQKIEATKKYLQQNPNDQAARAWLQRAQSQGVHALGPDDVRRFVSGMEAARIAQEHHSLINPFEGTAVKSDAPVTSLKYQHNLIFPDVYKSNRGDVIPARAIDKYNTTLGLGGQRRTDFDNLKR